MSKATIGAGLIGTASFKFFMTWVLSVSPDPLLTFITATEGGMCFGLVVLDRSDRRRAQMRRDWMDEADANCL